MHEIASKITRNNWDINIFSSGIRHRNILYERGISDDQIDSLIENVDEHCFKKQIRIEDFVNLVQEVAEYLKYYGCSIDTLPRLLGEKRAELEVLQQTIGSLKSSKVELLRENELTEKEINDYSRDKPLVETIKGLREEITDQWSEAMFYKTHLSMLESEWEIREIPENMTREEVLEAAQLLLRNAVDLVKVIKYIQKKAPLLPYRAGPRLIERNDNDNDNTTDKGKR